MVSAVALYVPPYHLLDRGAGLVGMMGGQIIDVLPFPEAKETYAIPRKIYQQVILQIGSHKVWLPAKASQNAGQYRLVC
jgi:hypothetical protein